MSLNFGISYLQIENGIFNRNIILEKKIVMDFILNQKNYNLLVSEGFKSIFYSDITNEPIFYFLNDDISKVNPMTLKLLDKLDNRNNTGLTIDYGNLQELQKMTWGSWSLFFNFQINV
jgi:hypothetical protein